MFGRNRPGLAAALRLELFDNRSEASPSGTVWPWDIARQNGTSFKCLEKRNLS